jgi:hypothetical protein
MLIHLCSFSTFYLPRRFVWALMGSGPVNAAGNIKVFHKWNCGMLGICIQVCWWILKLYSNKIFQHHCHNSFTIKFLTDIGVMKDFVVRGIFQLVILTTQPWGSVFSGYMVTMCLHVSFSCFVSLASEEEDIRSCTQSKNVQVCRHIDDKNINAV